MGTDACSRAGLEIPNLPKQVFEEFDRILPPYWSRGNPVDTVSILDPAIHPRCLEILARCREFDAVIVLGGMGMVTKHLRYLGPELRAQVEGIDVDFARKVFELLLECGKPILSAGIP